MKEMKSKKNFIFIVRTILIVVSAWMAITVTIQAFKCEKLTRTELFLRIPNSFVCDWIECP